MAVVCEKEQTRKSEYKSSMASEETSFGRITFLCLFRFCDLLTVSQKTQVLAISRKVSYLTHLTRYNHTLNWVLKPELSDARILANIPLMTDR